MNIFFKLVNVALSPHPPDWRIQLDAERDGLKKYVTIKAAEGGAFTAHSLLSALKHLEASVAAVDNL